MRLEGNRRIALNLRPMSWFSRLRNVPESPAPRGASGLAWRKGDYLSAPTGNEVHVVYRRAGTPAIVPAFALEFAEGCLEFAPLETHLERYAEQHALGGLQLDALRTWLPRLADAGALVSSQQIAELCAAGPAAEAPPPIATIGFPTGGPRAELLRRAIESFAGNARAHGRTVEFLIADSSAQAGHRRSFRELAAQLSSHMDFPVRYSGEEERRAFIEALHAKGAASREALEFALLDPLAVGFACGANRNALLLHGAGSMVCSVDDDVICRLARLPDERPAPWSLFSNCDPYARWLFRDAAEGERTARFVDEDFLASHERLLGRAVNALIAGNLPPAHLSLEDAGDDVVRRLSVGPTQVRTTYLGHYGDPGIPSSTYYLFYERANRDRLTASDEHYRAVFGSRRVLAAAPTVSLGDASISPGMAMGLDHRTLLPPFFPVLHAEDFVFGATAWQCCAGSLSGHLPRAIQHEPPPGKSILQPRDLGPGRRVVLFEFAHLMRRVIRDTDLPQRATTADRTLALGRHLREVGRLPAVDFLEVIRQKILEHESEKLGYLDKQLEQPEVPELWRRDVEAYLTNARESLAEADFDVPLDLKGQRLPEENRAFMQRLFARFGQLLEEWPGIVEGTRELQSQGIALAVQP